MKHVLLLILSLGFTHPSKPSPYIQMVDKTVASTVFISGTEEGYPYSCSGWVVRYHRVMTAAHCIGDAMVADSQLPVTVLKQDMKVDLAVLLVDTTKVPLALRNTPVIRFESLTAIGFGFGWSRLVVLAVRPFLLGYTPNEDIYPGMWVQTQYIGGMSGGPVVDSKGLVVGIVQRGGGGVGYGVEISAIKEFLKGVE